MSTARKSGRTPDKTGSHTKQTDPETQETLTPSHPEGTSASGIPGAELFDGSADGVEMPEVQQNAIDAATAKQSTANAARDNSGLVDGQGRSFDASLHETLPDGSPRISPAGKLRNKRGGGGKSAKSKLESPQTQPAPDPAMEKSAAQIEATAMACAQLTFMCGMMIGGPEFAPIIDKDKNGTVIYDEPEQFKSAYRDVCIAYGITDIPPWCALALVGVGYVGKRWSAPKFAEKRSGWWTRIKVWWITRSDEKKQDMARARAQADRAKHGVNRTADLAAGPAAH